MIAALWQPKVEKVLRCRRTPSPPLRRFLDGGAAEQERHILLARPRLEEIAVVRALGIARLARGVDGPGIIPIADIDHHPPADAADDPEILGSVAIVVDG